MNYNLANALARTLGTTTSLENYGTEVEIDGDMVGEDGASLSPVAPLTGEPVLEAQETQIDSEGSMVDDLSDDMDDTERDVETLESIHQSLAKSLNYGGLNTPSFEMMNITMNHIYGKYGIDASSVMPSMEAFEGDRNYQTQVSMEKVKDTLNSMGKTLKEFWAKLVQTVKKFFFNLKNYCFSVEKRAKALLTALNKPENKNLSAANLQIDLYSANKLFIGKTILSKTALATKLRSHIGYFSDVSSTVWDAYDTAANHLTKIVTDDKAAAENAAAMIVTTTDKLLNLNSKLAFQNAKITRVEFGTGEGKSLIPGLKLQLDSPPAGMNTKVEALTSDEIGDILTSAIIPCCKMIKDAKDITSIRGIDAYHKKLEGPINADNNNMKLDKDARRYLKDVVAHFSKTMEYMNGVNKAALDYCAQSFAAQKKAVSKDSATENAKLLSK